MAKELAKELINAGAHFGHASSRWNPKMEPYIFAKRGNIHIINIKETLRGILIAKRLLANIIAGGKDVVFVGTKRQAQKSVEKAAEKCGMHYVSERWLGGMLTNFRTVRSQLQRLEELEAMQQTGALEKESKKQASRLKRELRKIKTNLEGVRKMNRIPGAVIVVDAGKEHLALAEAKKLGISAVGVIDTDCNPDAVDVAIPANDDSIKTIEIVLNELADAVAVGKTMTPVQQQDASGDKPKRSRSRRPALASARADKAPAPAAKPTEQSAASQPAAAEAPAPAEPAKAEDKSNGEEKTEASA